MLAARSCVIPVLSSSLHMQFPCLFLYPTVAVMHVCS
jgi:hypothetical protein